MPVTFVEIDGGKLAVEVEGPRNGPLIICAPGMGDMRDAYAPLATQLVASGYRVARFDLRGHGDSTTTFAHHGDEAVADDFLAVIGELGASKAVLAGASLSAGAATIVAGRNPEVVAGLVLLGPFLRNPITGFGGTAVRWLMHVAFYWPWGPYIWKAYAATLWPGLGGQKSKERATASTAMLKQPGRWRAFHATTAGANHDAVTPWLERAKKAPALVVMGDKDPDWGTPVKEMEWVATNFDDAETVTVEGAGHAPMLEKAEDVGPKVLAFLKRIGL